MKELWLKSNVEEKIKEYEQEERRGNISFSHFTKLFFELKVAAICSKKGLKVTFVKKQSKPTPDLKVTSPMGETYIECKKKDSQVRLQQVITDRYGRIEVGILNNMKELKQNYIGITIDREIEEADVKQIITLVVSNIATMQTNFQITNNKITIIGQKLFDFDTLRLLNDSIVNIDLSLYEHFNWNVEAQGNISLDDFKYLQTINPPTRNLRIVGIHSSFKVSQVESILYSVKDASDQLLNSSGHGVIAVEINLWRQQDEAEIKRVLDATYVQLRESMLHVSAVIFFMELTIQDVGEVRRETHFLYFGDYSKAKQLPTDIAVALRKSIETPFSSLLLDS